MHELKSLDGSHVSLPPKTVWPSGLRRWLQVPVRKGVGSNHSCHFAIRILIVGSLESLRERKPDAYRETA